MRIHLDIEDGIQPEVALRCVAKVIGEGKISNYGTSYCYATRFDIHDPDFDIVVLTRQYRKSDCFKIIKYKP